MPTGAIAAGHKAKAQPAVLISAGDHKGLSRVLISWRSTVAYKIEDSPGLVTITFDHPAKPEFGDSAKQGLRNVTGISIGDDPAHLPANLVVKLAVKPDARSRAFKTGNIVIVDILDGNGTPNQAPSGPATAQAAPPDKDKKDTAAASETVLHVQPVTAAAGLAAFRRGAYLWVALDGKAVDAAPTIEGPLARSFTQPARYAADGATLFRYAYKPASHDEVLMVRQHSGGWDIVIPPAIAAADATPDAPASTPAASTLAIKAVADDREVTVAAPGAMHMVTFADPDLGDMLHIAPLPTAGEYIAKPRRYAEANLLQSIQGVVVVSHSDRPQIAAGLGTVTIAGMPLAANSDSAAAGPPLFDFDAWYKGGPSELMNNRRKLDRENLGEDGPGLRAQTIDMARLFLANGWGQEAIGALGFAQGVDPAVASSPDFRALRGAASALAGRPEAASADLTSDGLAGQPEAAVWRALGESFGGSDQRQEAFSILRSNVGLFEKYPPELKQRFSLALAALAVEANDQAAMESALKLLTKGEAPNRQTLPAIATLKAGIALQKGKFPEADKLYATVPTMLDQYWTALAGLAAVDGGLAQGSLTKQDAIAKLDSLRFEWRGDDYEYRVLEKLGELYLETGDYRNGLDTLTNLIGFGTGSRYADAAKQKVIDTAKLAFSPEKAVASSPLATLELYNTFVPYLPPHTISDEDIRNLSDRLAAIGDLDQAIGLIQPQMDAATDPAAKARLGARIAALHLLDDKPDLALKALADSDNDKIDAGLKSDRKLLQARALFKAGKPDPAAPLQGLASREADALRVEIAWPQKDWKGAAEALGRLSGQPTATGDITEEQANIVLNEAVALNLSGDAVTLEQLRKSFGPAMAKTKRASAFALMTSPASDTNSPSIEAVKASVSGLDIFENYLSAYRKGPEKS